MNVRAEVGLISGLNKSVAVIDLDHRDEALTKKRHHSVLVLDCSGSMAGSIHQVKEDSKKYVNDLNDDEFVSVIVFSGHNTAKLIAGPTQCNKAGKTMVARVIDKEVYVRSTTVFSEPLELVLLAMKNAAGNDTVHNAMLFTDGCAVPTNWSRSEECSRATEVTEKLREFGAVVSTVCYGVYYDEKFIDDLMTAGGNRGVCRHISEIDDFGPAIQEVRNVFQNTTLGNLSLKVTPSKGKMGRALRALPEVRVVGSGGKAVLNNLYGDISRIYFELSEPCDDLKVEVNGWGKSRGLFTVKAEKLSKDSARDYVCALGVDVYMAGDYAAATELFARVSDGLAEKVSSSYTPREARETKDLLRRFFRDKKFIGEGLKPTGPNHCVLNVLRTLIEDDQNVVYIGKGAYKRSGELTRDPRVIESPLGRSLRVAGYRSNQERFNFSLLCLKDVKVRPEGGVGAPQDMKIWRTYNVILDGNLHLPELEATLSQPSFDVLKDSGVIDSNASYDGTRTYTLNLRNLKMISSAWANPATLGLVNLMREEAELEAEQKALNARRKAVVPPSAPSDDDEVYRESAEKVTNVPVETYEAPCAEYRLMKYKAKDYDCSKMTYDEANTRVKAVRGRLIVVRYIIRAIIFAMETVGSKIVRWDAGKTTKRGECEKLEQTSNFQGAELKRVTWKEKFVCS